MTGREKSFNELLNESEVKDFLFLAEREMFPKMKASVISIVIGSEEPDAKLALEVGAAVLFDKPMLIVVPNGRTIPANLRRLATVVLDDFDLTASDSQARFRQALESMGLIAKATA